jgi:hypothetical protein
MTVQNLAKQELKKMNESYYGSDEQIKNEIAIMKSSKIEMLYNETIEEWLYKVSTSVNG